MKMEYKIALAGNPNCGKTTLFNALTGSAQYVGNWPGVTVEKKEGKLKGFKDVTVTDLPGIYSLSPYTLEEVVARNYLINERPDVILNIIDGTNIERNLYLTTQLCELGIPVICAVNMIDVVKKNGDVIKLDALSKELGVKVCEISALKGTGVKKAAEMAAETAKAKEKSVPHHTFEGPIEHAIAHIEEAALHDLPEEQQRWFAIKIFERDEKVLEQLKLSQDKLKHIEKDIEACEKELDDDAESIITAARYDEISNIVSKCCKKKRRGALSSSDKIDKIVTNRILALPIFAVIMFVVYWISMGPFGSMMTDWANDGLFGDGWHLFGIGSSAYEEAAGEYELEMAKIDAFIEAAGEEGIDTEAVAAALEAEEPSAEDEASVEAFLTAAAAVTAEAEITDEEGAVTDVLSVALADFETALEAEEPDPADYGVWVPGIPVLIGAPLEAAGTADWLSGLVLDGIVAGVGAVLGFVPQMLILFFMLCILEDIGYMARIAFIMDRIFRRFGLSGKSFIPMLIGTGCGVPGVMASRTIEQDRDRKMTIMTTCFIPCGAKMPIIGLIAGALFGGSGLVAVSAYFIGVAAIVVSGIILKKTKPFAGEPAPFVMELPAYHIPSAGNVLRGTWERGWSFIKRAGTVILLSSILLWFLQGFGFTDGSFGMVEDNNTSLLASIGRIAAPIFAPLGWGDWKATVATVTGLIAKENVVATFGVLYGFAEVAEDGAEIWGSLGGDFTAVSAYSFMIFNLLCAPCFAAMGAIKREMNNAKWTWFAIGYMCIFAYCTALIVYQIGGLISGQIGFGAGTAAAVILIAAMLYLLFRKGYQAKSGNTLRAVDAAR